MPTAQNGLLVIVQARYESQRFPGKVLAPLLGQPMLLWQLVRVEQMRTPHTLVVACPDTVATHTYIRPLLMGHGYCVEIITGDPADVLTRCTAVAGIYNAQEIVRLCGDTPLIDPAVIDQLIATHHWTMLPRPDLTELSADWPDGTDCEIMSCEALRIANAEATALSDREHVSPYIWQHPERFRCAGLPCPFPLQGYQFSVDTPYDLTLIEQTLKHTLARVGFTFTWQDLWLTLELHPVLKRQILARPARNNAYTAQVAAETGAAVQSWEVLRYKQETAL